MTHPHHSPFPFPLWIVLTYTSGTPKHFTAYIPINNTNKWTKDHAQYSSRSRAQPPRKVNPSPAHTCSCHKPRTYPRRHVSSRNQRDAHQVHFALHLQRLSCSNLFTVLPSPEPSGFHIRFSSKKKAWLLSPVRPRPSGGCPRRSPVLPLESSTSSAGLAFWEAWWACEERRLTIRGLGRVRAFPWPLRECSFSWLIVMVEKEHHEHL